jgi:hypothetical protein
MNYIYLLLAAAGLILIVLYIIVRKQSRKRNASRKCLEEFLLLLASKFYKTTTTFEITKPLESVDVADQISSAIARQIAELAPQLQTLLADLKMFPKEHRNLFGHGDETDTFVLKMLPNLKIKYLEFKHTGWKATDENCRDFLFKVSKMRTFELLTHKKQ